MMPPCSPSEAHILLAWDECGDVVHCHHDAIASSLLRQCGAHEHVGGGPRHHQQQQQQQHLDSKRSRPTSTSTNGGSNDKSSLLLLGHLRQQEALLQKIRQMEYTGIKDSQEMEQLEAELNYGSSSNPNPTVDIGGRAFTLSNHEISVNSNSNYDDDDHNSNNNNNGGDDDDFYGSNNKSKENKNTTGHKDDRAPPYHLASISTSTSTSKKRQQKGGVCVPSVRTMTCKHGTRRRQLRTNGSKHAKKGTKQPLVEFYVSKRIDAAFKHDRMADTDDYQWNDGERRSLRRRMEASQDNMRDIDHVIKGDMLRIHQSCRSIITNNRDGEQPRLRAELHKLGARALASTCVEISTRLIRYVLKRWHQGVRRDIRHEQLLKLQQCQSLDRLVKFVKHLRRERLKSSCLCWCAESKRRREVQHELSSTLIQSALRRKFALKKLEQLRDERRDWALRTLQRFCRGGSARMSFRIMRTALVLQRFVRCCLARTMLKCLKLERRRQKGAVMVQKISRGRKGRKAALQALDRRRRRAAAVHIQRISRGRKDRIEHAEYKERLAAIKLNTAATTLQAEIRRCRDSKIVAQLHEQREQKKRKVQLEKERVTIMLQRIYRGHKGRLITRRIHQEQIIEAQRRYKSACCIQSTYRSRVANQRVKLIRRKARSLMIQEACQWVEMGRDDGKTYYNQRTGETLFEPPITGYTRHTDTNGPLLHLQSGAVVSGESSDDALMAKLPQDS